MDPYRRYPGCPEQGTDDAATTRNAASSDPASGHGPGAPTHPPASERQESEAAVADVERDLSELTEKARKADEYLELAKRTKADFENYRKRAAREASVAQERGVIKLTRELLPAVDNLERAVAALNGAAADDELASGIKLVHDEVIAALGRAGVELFSPIGERFDPERHEAVAQMPADGAEPGTIIEVYQQGCRLGDAVIRPARVVVAG
jgi:molecular chaperone GrpE